MPKPSPIKTITENKSVENSVPKLVFSSHVPQNGSVHWPVSFFKHLQLVVPWLSKTQSPFWQGFAKTQSESWHLDPEYPGLQRHSKGGLIQESSKTTKTVVIILSTPKLNKSWIKIFAHGGAIIITGVETRGARIELKFTSIPLEIVLALTIKRAWENHKDEPD